MDIKDINESNAVHTKDEMQAIQNIVTVIRQCVEEGLNKAQKQLVRNAHAAARGENENQPEWSETDYLEMLVECCFMHGITVGKQRQIRQTQKDVKEIFSNARKGAEEIFSEATKLV